MSVENAQVLCGACGEPAGANDPEPLRPCNYYGERIMICWECWLATFPPSVALGKRKAAAMRLDPNAKYIGAGTSDGDIQEKLRRGWKLPPEPFGTLK